MDKEDRKARFKALQKRANDSSSQNRKELYEEHKKRGVNAKEQARLERRKDEAEEELAKLDAEARGEDYYRKRAWEWTVEESEKWDKKQQAKQQAREASQQGSDLTTAAERAYAKKMREFEPDHEAYEKSKQSGSDDNTVFDHKPTKKQVDKLVNGMRNDRAKRQKSSGSKDDSQVTSYINEQNKAYSKSLSQHYDKYNQGIRDALDQQEF